MQDVGFGNLRDLSSICKAFQVFAGPIIFKKEQRMLQDPGYFAKINREYLTFTATRHCSVKSLRVSYSNPYLARQ